MADSAAVVDGLFSLADLSGSNRFVLAGQEAAALVQRAANGVQLTEAPTMFGVEATAVDEPEAVFAETCYAAYTNERWSLEDVWFDQVIVRPILIALGNILSDTERTINVYSSYRTADVDADSITNNLGAGTTLADVPGLPFTIGPQSGFAIRLQVSSSGQATINDTIDFAFDTPETLFVTVTGSRITVFPFRPESPLRESLGFLTDILEKIDGSEQRIALRKNPRQSFNYRVRLAEDDRRYFDNLMYDWQSRVFGVPIWTEPAFLTSAVVSGATTIPVDSTAYGSFKAGELCILFTDRFTFDALEIQTVNPTSLVLASPLNNGYAANTQVLPVMSAQTAASVRGSRHLNNLLESDVVFRNLNNDKNLADVSAFNSLNSKVLLDGPNAAERQMSETLERKLTEFDGQTGIFGINSVWTRGKRKSVKGFVTHSRQELWEVRQLLHALKGRQVSFYLPTFYDDIKAATAPQNASQDLVIENVGFVQFAQSRMPLRGILRLIKTDGTVLLRTVLSSTAIDTATEQISVDSAWPSTIPLADIEKIDFVQLVRSDTDDFKIIHADALGNALITFPVKTVFE